MFEPQLRHNLEAFNELTRKKRRVFFILLIGIIPASVFIAVVPQYTGLVVIAFPVAVGLVVVLFEVKKTLVFMRDLREQRESRKR